jgi:hypothetical protein
MMKSIVAENGSNFNTDAELPAGGREGSVRFDSDFRYIACRKIARGANFANFLEMTKSASRI